MDLEFSFNGNDASVVVESREKEFGRRWTCASIHFLLHLGSGSEAFSAALLLHNPLLLFLLLLLLEKRVERRGSSACNVRCLLWLNRLLVVAIIILIYDIIAT